MVIEKYVDSGSDPLFLGDHFCCIGAWLAKLNQIHPLGRGENVGIELKFTTKDDKLNVIDDRTNVSLKRCLFRNNRGICSKGDPTSCPVAGAVTDEEFSNRVAELKKLEQLKE